MDIYYLGHSCFKIKGKSATLIIDPFNPEFTGIKLAKDLTCDLVLSTHDHQDHANVQATMGEPLVITGPGEYEKKGVNVIGIKTYHDAEKGVVRGKNTIYQVQIDNINIVHLGDLGHELSDEQLSQMDEADILMIPVGGGPTIDAEIASKVVSALEPKIVIPMHFKTPELKFELAPLENFLKEMGAENVEAIPKLSITKDKLPEVTTVVVLSKS